jgi:NitT/TauT family transport system ATP-binding protein
MAATVADGIATIDTMVRLDNVGKIYPGGTEALRGASLSIARGEFVCLLGASGCGKSTLLRIAAGFEAATAGAVVVGDRAVTGPGPDRGMVFQDYGLFPWMTVRRNIGFGPAVRGLKKAEVSRIADRFVSMVGLDRFANSYPHQLSGGMKQRVAIARVLANDAKVVLMDEPFGALDAMTRESMNMELMRVWSEERKTVIFITHSIPEAVLLGDRVVVMSPRPGRISEIIDVDIGRPRTLQTMATPRFGEICDRIRTIFGAQSLTATAL